MKSWLRKEVRFFLAPMSIHLVIIISPNLSILKATNKAEHCSIPLWTIHTCVPAMAFFTMAMANFLHSNFSLQAPVDSHVCTKWNTLWECSGQEPTCLYTNSVKRRMLRECMSPKYQHSASSYANVTLTE